MRCLPLGTALSHEHIDASAARTGRPPVGLAQRKEKLAAAMPRMRKAFETLVRFFKPAGQPVAVQQPAAPIVFGDEAAQHAVGVDDRFDQRECGSTTLISS